MLQRKRLLKICRHRIKNLTEILEKASNLKEELIIKEVEELISKQKHYQNQLKLNQIEVFEGLIECPVCESLMDQITSTHITEHGMNLKREGQFIISPMMKEYLL